MTKTLVLVSICVALGHSGLALAIVWANTAFQIWNAWRLHKMEEAMHEEQLNRQKTSQQPEPPRYKWVVES